MLARHTPLIEINFQPSYILLGWYLLVSIAALLGIAYVPASLVIKLLMGCVVILMALYIILRDALLALPWSWQSVHVNALGGVELITKAQMPYEVLLLPSSVCHPCLVVLRFRRLGRAAGFQSSACLCPIRVRNFEQLRRLRVWMRWALRPALTAHKIKQEQVNLIE